MVLNVFALTDKKVRDCMVPREKMSSLDVNSPPDKVLEVARLGGAYANARLRRQTGQHRRHRQYEGPLLPLQHVGSRARRGLRLYPATFLDPDEPVANAFRLFRKSHRPMAVVRDAASVVVGLITLEDVLEEIVGDIEDEHDVPVPKLKLARRRPSPAPKLGLSGERVLAMPPKPKP